MIFYPATVKIIISAENTLLSALMNDVMSNAIDKLLCFSLLRFQLFKYKYIIAFDTLGILNTLAENQL